jgi:hypothetical protein
MPSDATSRATTRTTTNANAAGSCDSGEGLDRVPTQTIRIIVWVVVVAALVVIALSAVP